VSVARFGGGGGRTRLARAFLVFGLGFFALLTQTLLLREFLTAFEGNELGIAAFFGSWFLWIAAGALVGRGGGARLVASFAPLTLLYLPAYLLEHSLVTHVRELAGVAAYELFPYGRMFVLSLLTNAPVSFVTGFLFTLACRAWGTAGEPGRDGTGAGAPSHVYVFETLGGAAGGVAVTALLAAGVPSPTVFLVASLVLASGVAVSRRGPATLRILPAIAIAAALVAGLGEVWAQRDAAGAWGRLLPRESYGGRFATAQASYLHGEREGQFLVMCGGGVTEALPDAEHAREIAAISLAQHPDAARVVVVGPGALAISLAFLEVPRIRSVTWLPPDPEYPAEVMRVLPPRFRDAAARLDAPGRDIRAWLADDGPPVDLVLLDLPDATTLVLNRYFTREFFAEIADRLSPGGVVGIRISGGANFLGGELAILGSAALATIESQFRVTALKPGDETWIFASMSEGPIESPAALRDRFASIEGASELFPPDAILSLFPPDRIAFQRAKYREAVEQAGAEFLVNTDDRPKALFFAMLVALREAGVRGLAAGSRTILGATIPIAVAAILAFVVVRLLYLGLSGLRAERRRGRGFEAGVLVGSAGVSGMSLGILLMFAYQSRFGSLFLDVGLVSALFMAGSFVGSLAAVRLVDGRDRGWAPPALLALQAAAIVAVAGWTDPSTRASFRALFFGAGVFTGAYFPLAARWMRERGAGATGAALEAADHVGAAAGSVLTGLVLLPVAGSAATAGLVALLLVALLPLALPRRGARLAFDPVDRRLRPAGWTLAGMAGFALLASWLVSEVRGAQAGMRLEEAARAMAEGGDLVAREGRGPDGSTFRFYEAPDPGGPERARLYVFPSAPFADAPGYGGPIHLAIRIDPEGNLEEFRVVRSRETPAYLALVEPWARKLLGRSLLDADPFADVDAVSGATLTSRAMLRTLRQAGRAFARDTLGLAVAGEEPPPRPHRADPNVAWLAGFVAAAAALRFRPGRWRRILFLLASFGILGIGLNLQYSTQHVFALLGGSLPAIGFGVAFFMVVVVPVVTLLVGNVYCGYVCPFGAMQELAGELRPRRLASDPSKPVWRIARLVKYLLLFVLAGGFALTRDASVLDSDPLTTLFGAARGGATFAIALGALLLSIPYRRFWCRNLCPAGAFLALLNRARLLRRLSPEPRPGFCDLGVRHPLEMDCIRCDRCMHENR